MTGSNLAALEAAHAGRFRFKHAGQTFTVPGPVDLPLHQVVGILESRHIPGTPTMAEWKRRALFDAWCSHYDLPSLDSLRRLMHLVDRYRDEIEYDLHTHANGADLTELWRTRRWRLLLNLIDHLPQNSWYSAAVANDPEHARMLAEAMAAREDEEAGSKSPPLHTWTQEMAMLTALTEAVRHVSYTVAAVNAPKGKGPTMPEPLPRPVTAIDKARREATFARKKRKHEALAKRLLPHKR